MNDTENDAMAGSWLSRNPWIWVVVVFVILTLGLTAMVTIANRTFPGNVPLESGVTPTPASATDD